MKMGSLRESKTHLENDSSLLNPTYILGRDFFRSFHTINKGSVCEKAAKLLAIKVGCLQGRRKGGAEGANAPSIFEILHHLCQILKEK